MNSILPVSLPPTPNASDEEVEEDIRERSIKLQRRGTVSLADLIPLATAAHKAKHRSSVLYNENEESPLARALTKVKLGVTTHKLKEKFLTNEWIRLALSVPLDESTINKHLNIQIKVDYQKNKRTKEIVKWYEHKYKRDTLPLNELQARVDILRQQRLEYVQLQQQYQKELDSLMLPSPP